MKKASASNVALYSRKEFRGKSIAAPVAIGKHGRSVTHELQPSKQGELKSYLPTFRFGTSRFCTYCGDPAESMDHVIPLAWSSSVTRKRNKKHGDSGPMTWACRHCNSTLKDSFFSDFKERCEYMHKCLDKAAKPVLWSEASMNEMDYSLQGLIKRENNRRMWLRFRADWWESRDYLLNIENLLWEPCLDRYSRDYDEAAARYFASTIYMIRELQKIHHRAIWGYSGK